MVDALAESSVIERPITNWLDAFNVWDSENTADMIRNCTRSKTCAGCVMPYNHSVPFAKRVHRFLYDVNLTSQCCQVLCVGVACE